MSTRYQAFFGVYIGLKSHLYRCPPDAPAQSDEALSRANASAQAQRAQQAAKAAAAHTAQQAQMRAMEEAHKSAIENAQRVYQQNAPNF